MHTCCPLSNWDFAQSKKAEFHFWNLHCRGEAAQCSSGLGCWGPAWSASLWRESLAGHGNPSTAWLLCFGISNTSFFSPSLLNSACRIQSFKKPCTSSSFFMPAQPFLPHLSSLFSLLFWRSKRKHYSDTLRLQLIFSSAVLKRQYFC